MNVSRPVLALPAVGLVLTAVALVRLPGFPRPPAAPPPEPRVLAISTSILGIPLWLAEREGVSAAALEVIPLAAPDQVTALTTGRVDAVSAFAPYSTQCRAALGAGARTCAAGLRYTGYASLVAAPDFSRRRPAAALRLLRATDRAIRWLRGHRREAIAFAAERLGTAAAVVAETWDRLQPNLSLDQGYVTLRQAPARRATAAGFAPGGALPEFHDLIDVSVLQRLHPESVTVIGTP